MKYYIQTFIFLLFSSVALSQQFVEVIDETLTVNSQTSFTGYTRNITSITLPNNSTGYIYRLSVSKKGGLSTQSPLFKLLKTIDPSTALATSFADFVVKNNDGSSIDAFIFVNPYDANNFYAKKDDDWSSCKSMANRTNCCYATSDCLNKTLYFGFRNNNISQGLDVKLEVVAVVDTTLKTANYAFTIQNGASTELSFYLSTNNVEWVKTSLQPGYQKTLSLPQSQLHIKVYTTQTIFVQYKLEPHNRYRLIYNPQTRKWDVVSY